MNTNQKTIHHFVKSTVWTILGLLLATTVSSKATLFVLKASDGNGTTTSFNGIGNWVTNGTANAATTAPGAGNSYSSGNFFLRTPQGSSGATFGGDMLYMSNLTANTSSMLFKSVNNATFTFPNLVFGGSGLGNGGDVSGPDTLQNIAGTITMAGSGWISIANTATSTRSFGVLANISGSGALTNSGGGLGYIQYFGNNSAFTGPMVVSSYVLGGTQGAYGPTTIKVGSQANLGGNPGVFNAAQLLLDGGILVPTNSFALTNANSGVTITTNGGTFNVSSGITLTVSNPIVANGSVTLSGGGNLTLAGTTYLTNNVTVSAGTLNVTGAGLTNYSGSTLLAGNTGTATTTNIGGSLTILGTNNIAGSSAVGTETINGNLNLNGGTLVMDLGNPAAADLITLTGSSRAVTKAGTTTILPVNGSIANGTYTLISNISTVSGAGSFSVSGASPRGTPSYAFASTPPSITLTVSGVSPAAITWVGTNGGNWDINTTNWLNGLAADKFYNGDSVTFNDTGKTNYVTLVGSLTPGSVTVNSISTNYTFGGSGSIGGPTALAKSGASTLTVGNANSYTGGTTVGGGILQLGNPSALGSPSGGASLAVVNSGGTIDLNANTPNSTNTIIIQGNGSGTYTGCLVSSSGWSYFGGTQIGVNNVSLAGNATVGGNTGNYFGIGFNGSSGLNGNGYNLTKVGVSTLFLMGPASSPVSNFNIQGGQVIFYNQNNWLGTGATVVCNGGNINTWTPNGGGVTIPYNIVITNWPTTIGNDHGPYSGAAPQDVYNGNIALNNPLTLSCSVSSGRQTINGSIFGSYGITAKVSTGDTIALNGFGSYTGPTIVTNGGTLAISSANQGGGSYTVYDGSTLRLSLSPNYATMPSSSLTLGASTGCTLSLSNLVGMPLVPVINTTTLTVNGVCTIIPPAIGYANGVYPLIQYSTIAGTAGSFVLGGTLPRGVVATIVTNNVFGYNFIALNVTSSGDLWTGANSSNWNTNSDANWSTNGPSGTPTVYSDGDAVTFDDTASQNNGQILLPANVAPSCVIFNVTNNNGYVLGQNNAGGNLTGSMALIKNGSGTIAIANTNNTFTGGTYINGGILQLQCGNYNSSGALNYNGGNVYVNGGTLDVNGVFVPNYQGYGPDGYNVYVQGSGYNGQGAIVNNISVSNPGSFPPDAGYITLTGNATIGGSQELDMNGGVSPQLNSQNNSYTLTKIGAGSFRIRRGTVSSNFGNFNLLGGALSYEGAVAGLGNPTNYIFIGTNATLQFNLATVPLNKQIICSNGASFNAAGGSGGGNNILVGVVTVIPGATVNFKSSGGSLVFSNAISIPNGTLAVNGGSPIFAGGITNISGTVTMTGSSIIAGPVNIPFGSTLQYNGNYYNTLTFSNALSGSGSLGIQFQSVVAFTASNTYNGNITIPYCGSGVGTHINLIGNGSISQVPTITLQGIASGQPHAAYIDASGRTDGSLTLSQGQTLLGDNGCQVIGNLTVGTSATLSLPNYNSYSSQDTFYVTGSLTNLSGSTNILWINGDPVSPANTQVSVTGTLVYGGTLVINTNGVTIQAGSSFQLFSAGSYNGSFANIVPASPGPNLAWDTSNLATSGTLAVVSTGPGTFTQPTGITSISFQNGTNIVLGATNGQSGYPYYLLSSTNLTLPISQWTAVATNVLGADGNYTFVGTNAANTTSVQQFYILSNTNNQ